MKNLFFILLSISSFAFADDVYTWTDAEGNIHYSNTPSENQAQKAKLPEIEKQNIQSRIDELKNVVNQTCVKKGGVNCEAGADVDGSVICVDGSKDSEENFREACSEVRLTAELVLPPKKNNKKLTFLPITVSVRNTSAIKASEVRVELNMLRSLSGDVRQRVTLEGPTEIDGYGISEYTYTGKMIDERILRKANLKVSCQNCWNPALPFKQN